MRKGVVFICRSHRAAEKAVKALRKAGCGVQNLSVIGKDGHGVPTDRETSAPKQDQQRVTQVRSFWCRMWNLLAGDAFLSVDQIGPIIAAGPLAGLILAAWADSGIFEARSPLRSAMSAIGVRRENLQRYEAALLEEGFLVVAQGPTSEVLSSKRNLRGAAASVFGSEQIECCE